jgi:hypothetical protein
MEGKKIYAIDWESLPSGTMLAMKNFPSVTLLKLDNKKGIFNNYGSDYILVDIKKYESKENGGYYVFQESEGDWHPLTNRLWKYD